MNDPWFFKQPIKCQIVLDVRVHEMYTFDALRHLVPFVQFKKREQHP